MTTWANEEVISGHRSCQLQRSFMGFSGPSVRDNFLTLIYEGCGDPRYLLTYDLNTQELVWAIPLTFPALFEDDQLIYRNPAFVSHAPCLSNDDHQIEFRDPSSQCT
ncbi:MAG: hypothetical protein ACHQUC_09460 [Chlamydiales bacterium]